MSAGFAVASSMPFLVSLVGLQKFTFQPCAEAASMRMLRWHRNLWSAAGNHDRAHLGVLEAQPLHRVIQLMSTPRS